MLNPVCRWVKRQFDGTEKTVPALSTKCFGGTHYFQTHIINNAYLMSLAVPPAVARAAQGAARRGAKETNKKCRCPLTLTLPVTLSPKLTPLELELHVGMRPTTHSP